MGYVVHGRHVREGVKLALPVVVSNLSQTIISVVSAVLVGHAGTTALAAASLSNALLSVALLFGVGVSYGITPLIAASGDDKRQAGELLRHGLVINTITGLFLVGALLVAEKLMFAGIRDQAITQVADPYLRVLALSVVPGMAFRSFGHFMDGLSRTRTTMMFVLGGAALEVALGYALIFGRLGFPAMGLVGAGWAACVARVLMLLIVALYIHFSTEFVGFRGLIFGGSFSTQIFKKILAIGLPTALQFTFEVAAFDFSAVMMGWLGAKELAAHQIAVNLAATAYSITSGLAAATTIRVSNEFGKQRIDVAGEVARSLVLVTIAVAGCMSALYVTFRNYIPLLYTDDRGLVTAAGSLLFIIGIFQLADALQVVFAGALRGLQDVRIPSVLMFIAYWVIGIPVGWLLGFKAGWGAQGIWCGLLIGLSAAALAMGVRCVFFFRQPKW